MMPTKLTRSVFRSPTQKGAAERVRGLVGDGLLGDLEAGGQAQEAEVGEEATPLHGREEVAQQEVAHEEHHEQDRDLAEHGQDADVPPERDGLVVAWSIAARLVSHGDVAPPGAAERRTPGRRSSAAPGCQGWMARSAERRRIHQPAVRPQLVGPTLERERRVRTEGAIVDLAVVADRGDDLRPRSRWAGPAWRQARRSRPAGAARQGSHRPGTRPGSGDVMPSSSASMVAYTTQRTMSAHWLSPVATTGARGSLDMTTSRMT